MSLPEPVDRPSLHGKYAMLRTPRPSDVADRLAAGRDAEFRRMVGAVGEPLEPFSLTDAEQWYAQLSGDPFAWVIEYGGRCIGLARLHGVSTKTRAGSIALGLFTASVRGRGIGTEVVGLLLRHAFDDLGLALLRVRVLSFNVRAMRCYSRCGFRESSREAVRLGNEAATDVLMELAAADFRALDGRGCLGNRLTER